MWWQGTWQTQWTRKSLTVTFPIACMSWCWFHCAERLQALFFMILYFFLDRAMLHNAGNVDAKSSRSQISLGNLEKLQSYYLIKTMLPKRPCFWMLIHAEIKFSSLTFTQMLFSWRWKQRQWHLRLLLNQKHNANIGHGKSVLRTPLDKTKRFNMWAHKTPQSSL